MGRVKISKTTVDAIAAGPRDEFYWDEALKGFGLKVTSNGSKSYVVQYRAPEGGASRRYTMGRHGSPWTPLAARKEAERLLLEVAVGNDPCAAKAEQRRAPPADLAFTAYATRYLEGHAREIWRPGTWKSAESNMRRYVIPVLRNKPINKIARPDLQAIFDSLPKGSPALPRNIFALVRRLFSWAVEQAHIERSPFEGYKSPKTVSSRERTLKDEELISILAATTSVGEPFGAIVRLLLLSGQRRSEVAAMEWSELSRRGALWSLQPARTKNNRTHEVPLSPPMIAELDAVAGGVSWPRRGPVFSTTGRTAVSGFSRMKRRLDAMAAAIDSGVAIQPWRLHDLRRTMATGLQRLHVRFEVTEALLNHFSGARGGVAGVYQRYDWTDEKSEAIDTWGAKVMALRSGQVEKPS